MLQILILTISYVLILSKTKIGNFYSILFVVFANLFGTKIGKTILLMNKTFLC